MKKVIFLLIAIACTVMIQAQIVGVNTKFPLGVLHIDPKGNNVSTTTINSVETADDIIIDATGNMGIGTANPTAKLDVRGSMQIIDGSQKRFNLFASKNTQGLGYWADPNTLFNPVAKWRISTNSITMSGQAYFNQATYTSTIEDKDGIGFAKERDLIVVPPGTYIVILSGELVNVKENIHMRLHNVTNVSLSPSAPDVWGADYYEKLSGASFMISQTATAKYGIRMQAASTATMKTTYPYFDFAPFNNVAVWYELIFIKVS